MTNEIYMMMSKTKEIDNTEINNTELEKLRERDYNVLQKIKTAYKRISEMKRNIVSMSQTAKDIENDMIDSINMFTNELYKNEFDKSFKIKEWWNENIEFDDNNKTKLTSTDVWNRFKKENQYENYKPLFGFILRSKNFNITKNYSNILLESNLLSKIRNLIYNHNFTKKLHFYNVLEQQNNININKNYYSMLNLISLKYLL